MSSLFLDYKVNFVNYLKNLANLQGKMSKTKIFVQRLIDLLFNQKQVFGKIILQSDKLITKLF